MASVFIASTSFATKLADGTPIVIVAGRHIASSDFELVKSHPEHWSPVVPNIGPALPEAKPEPVDPPRRGPGRPRKDGSPPKSSTPDA